MVAAQDDRVTVGRIERPFGVKGEVKVRPLSDVPGRFDRLKSVSVVGAEGLVRNEEVTHVRRAGASYIMRFAGITTPEAAGLLRGTLIQVPPREKGRAAEPADVFYECDLVGMRVEDEGGRALGTIDALWELPGQHIIVVRDGDRELLIPAVKNFVASVDVPGRRMIVRALEELVEDRDAL